MKVVKATKRFRQVSVLGSMLLAGCSIATFVVPDHECADGTDIKAAIGLLAVCWTVTFVLLLTQAIGLVKCLKKIPYFLMGYYIAVVVSIYFCQMMLWSGRGNDCRTSSPLMWYWLLSNVVFFYLIIAFGLASWGQYLCKVADTREEIHEQVVSEYKQSQSYLES
jgi:hypothetical protein